MRTHGTRALTSILTTILTTISGAAPAALWAAMLAAGCKPYDPDLGHVPFRCSTQEPRCPEGYLCVEHSVTEHLCERPDTPDAAMMSPDASGFTCADDSLIEPNQAIPAATPMPVPALGPTYQLENLAICPASDVDLFRFGIAPGGQTSAVEIELDPAQGGLYLDILDATGVAIRTGIPMEDQLGLVRATLIALEAGTYYARVQAADETPNNYVLRFLASPPGP